MNRKKTIKVTFHDAKIPTIRLTEREAQCAKYIMYGNTLRQTAHELKLSIRTVEFYFNNVKRKIGATKKSVVVSLLFASDFLSKFKE